MLQAGQRLGEFEIVGRLGKGGMGEVYEAIQDQPRRRVALKVLAPWLTEDDDALARFLREAEIQAQLEHPGIVPVIACGKTEDGQAYYTMQLVQGVTLSQLIRLARASEPSTIAFYGTPLWSGSDPTPHELPPVSDPSAQSAVAQYHRDRYRMVARIGVAAGKVLAFAHQRGFLHRDIKPSNLMLDQHGQVRLLDFGLTRIWDQDIALSAPGMIVGTLRYMSPEQARGDTIDPRSDIFSLGVTLYELASQGASPFAADLHDKNALRSAVRQVHLVPLVLHVPDVPGALHDIIARAMARDAAARYARAEDMVRDLERFLAAPNEKLTLPRKRRLTLRWLAPVTVGLLLAAGLAWMFLRPPEETLPSPSPSPAPVVKLAWPVDYPRERIDAAAASDLVLLAPRRDPAPVKEDDLRAEVTLDRPPPDDLRYLPFWRRRLSGSGKFAAYPDELFLMSARGGDCTTLAFDHDLHRRGFEFSAALEEQIPRERGEYAMGLFFGWSGETPGNGRAYFLQLDQRNPDKKAWPHGRLLLRRGVVSDGTLRLEELGPGLPVELALPEPAKKKLEEIPGPSWQTVRVRATRDQVVVQVGDRQVDFVPPFDPFGPLGIWVRGGPGRFGRATIRYLQAGG